MIWVLTLWLAAVAPQDRSVGTQGEDAVALAVYASAPAWDQFLAGVKAQRERWIGNAARATVPSNLAARIARAAPGLRLLIVAQDWCVDSVNTVPYIARLAASAQIPARIVDRDAGAEIMSRYRTRDARMVTPLVVLIREDRVVGTWVERPAPLQQAFASMATDADARRRFADRQAWYDADGGRTTMAEIVALAERAARGSRGGRLLPTGGQDDVLRELSVAGPGGGERSGGPVERVALDGAADRTGGNAFAAAGGGSLERHLP
jgi:hypothetical protein